MKNGIILFFLFLFVSGCGMTKRGTIPWEEETASNTPVPPASPDTINEVKPDSFVEEEEVPEIQQMQEFLQLAYKDWKGIPYLLGGAGYNGIDCSAFMQVVFEDYFSKKIPRTTLEQLRLGESVKRHRIRTGDLVFFKTGNRSYHVGVMINSNEFLHASTTEGVTISDLNYPYWKKKYWTTRRIL